MGPGCSTSSGKFGQVGLEADTVILVDAGVIREIQNITTSIQNQCHQITTTNTSNLNLSISNSSTSGFVSDIGLPLDSAAGDSSPGPAQQYYHNCQESQAEGNLTFCNDSESSISILNHGGPGGSSSNYGLSGSQGPPSLTVNNIGGTNQRGESRHSRASRRPLNAPRAESSGYGPGGSYNGSNQKSARSRS